MKIPILYSRRIYSTPPSYPEEKKCYSFSTRENIIRKKKFPAVTQAKNRKKYVNFPFSRGFFFVFVILKHILFTFPLLGSWEERERERAGIIRWKVERFRYDIMLCWSGNAVAGRGCLMYNCVFSNGVCVCEIGVWPHNM